MMIIRVCIDNNVYMPELQDQFEESLKPIFVFVSEPQKITFEDDIMLIIKSMIRKRKGVTPLMWEIFDHFPKLLTKSKGQMGDLLDTVNSYMTHDKEGFA